MIKRPYFQLSTLLISLFLLCYPALADSPKSSMAPYLRYLPTEGNLETSVLTLKNDRGQQIDLVSAVHVAGPEYYAKLNKKFQGYDVVLYELILPDDMVGQKLPSQLESGSGVSGMQDMIARSLGLVTQIAKVDYSPDNFVHADLTQSGLAQKMAERQENLMAYMMKILMSSESADQSQFGVTEQELAEIDLMSVLSGRTSAKDRRILKKLFGSALASSGGTLSALSDSALISERNKAALAVADRETQAGRRKMALFYGAAHMPDLHQQLLKKGFKPVKTEWITAWTQ